jgi:hypothetical protein
MHPDYDPLIYKISQGIFMFDQGERVLAVFSGQRWLYSDGF